MLGYINWQIWQIEARPYPGARPWKSEEQLLAALSEVPRGRALISSGLRFRTDLASGGGVGLDYAVQLLEAIDLDMKRGLATGLA